MKYLLYIIAAIVVAGAFYWFVTGNVVDEVPIPFLHTHHEVQKTTPPNVLVATSTQVSTTNGMRVAIANMAFSPNLLTIAVGTTVTWTNNDRLPHTVTSDIGGELGSPQLREGSTYTHLFEIPGTFSYHCTNHRTMTGTIIVK